MSEHAAFVAARQAEVPTEQQIQLMLVADTLDAVQRLKDAELARGTELWAGDFLGPTVLMSLFDNVHPIMQTGLSGNVIRTVRAPKVNRDFSMLTRSTL